MFTRKELARLRVCVFAMNDPDDAELYDKLAGALDSIEARLAPLTKRERDVMELMSSGMQNREIAAALGLKPQTVPPYVAAVLRKTGHKNRKLLIRACALSGAAP